MNGARRLIATLALSLTLAAGQAALASAQTVSPAPAAQPPAAATAHDGRWAVLVSGASGGPDYAAQLAGWRQAIASALTSRFAFPSAQIVQLVDETARDTGTPATADNVRKAFTALKGQVGKDDLVLVVLLGHGTFDGEQAKFNLVGPDLTASDWAVMLNAVPGRLVVVNTTESSAPFLEALAAKGRVVITATETAAQKYATVFPDYFAKALNDAASDLDKNGRVSIWEVFAAASGAVARHYSERAQLTTERAMLSDTGARTGVQASATGPQGTMARALYLDRDAAAESVDPAVRELIG
ncbi:MAG: hypothetical protein ABI880_12315, partial [Acidobacteriota bacterium]